MPSPGKQVTSNESSWMCFRLEAGCLTNTQMVVGGVALVAAAVGGFYYAKR